MRVGTKVVAGREPRSGWRCGFGGLARVVERPVDAAVAQLYSALLGDLAHLTS